MLKQLLVLRIMAEISDVKHFKSSHISFWANGFNKTHGRLPTDQEYEQKLAELELELKRAEGFDNG